MRKYSDYRNMSGGMIQQHVILELNIDQMPIKRISSRTSMQALDFIGILGGFAVILYYVMYPIGKYFSYTLGRVEICAQSFIKKEDENDGEDDIWSYIETDFCSSLEHMFDPFMRLLLWPFKLFSFHSEIGSIKRLLWIEKGNEFFDADLNIYDFARRVRELE